MNSPASIPKLLVSVRDGAEALAALRGGADILDVKEPARGALGRADAAVVRGIADLVRSEHPSVPLSVALGEVFEATDAMGDSLPAGITFAKLGLSNLADAANWSTRRWSRARAAFERDSSSPIQWVAVVYADGAGAPPPEEVIEAAFETRCAGILIDTFDKQSGGLWSHLATEQLIALARRTRQRGMFFGLAGRLSLGDVVQLRRVGPDVVAIRSAACACGERESWVSQARVQRFRSALRDAFAGAATAAR